MIVIAPICFALDGEKKEKNDSTLQQQRVVLKISLIQFLQ
jgi:hypothetical protein